MKKTRRVTATALSAAMALSFSAAGIALVANGSPVFTAAAEGETATTVFTDKEWEVYSGSFSSIEFDSETGLTTQNATPSYGVRATTVDKVKLDGLKLTMISNDFDNKGSLTFGFTLAKDKGDYAVGSTSTGAPAYDTYVGTFRHNNDNPNDTQMRYSSSNSHNHVTQYQIGCTTPEAALTNTTTSTFYSSYVFDDTTSERTEEETGKYYLHQSIGVTLEFSYVADPGCWQVIVSIAAGEKHSQQVNPQTIYFNSQYADSVLDENGECYLSSVLMSGCNSLSFYIEDDAKREARTAAESALDAYEAAVRAVVDAETYAASAEARAQAVAAVEAAVGNDQTCEDGAAGILYSRTDRSRNACHGSEHQRGRHQCGA